VIVKLSLSALKDTQWYEYLIRFVLGGAVTAFTGVVSSLFGASVGGLFLALPAIFCASATLIASHEKRRKREVGASGRRRGQQAAALDAAGAALGSLGMLAFALTFRLLVERKETVAFIAALVAWTVISVAAWWIWRRIRAFRRVAGPRRPEFAGRELT
jgi:hypothetical protein